MGIEALTHRDDGTQVTAPALEQDWQGWVSATGIRNWMLGDPLIDWLELYGDKLDAIPKAEAGDYDAKLDFGRFVGEKAAEFRAGMLRLFQERHEVVAIGRNRDDAKRLDRARETFAAMQRGAPIIHRAVLRDAEHRTYGSADFLIRSDVLREIFSTTDRSDSQTDTNLSDEEVAVGMSEEEAAVCAPDLDGADWHYRVVNAKYKTLELNAHGAELGNSRNAATKAELYLLNRMLGRLQGYMPPASYALGRGWRLTRQRQGQRETHSGDSALERLGRIPQDGSIAGGVLIGEEVERALEWVRRVRKEGENWGILPTPTVPELYPNMTGGGDGDLAVSSSDSGGDVGDGEAAEKWVSVKKYVASELKELTQLWRVGVGGRDKAHRAGIYQWDDSRITPDAVGLGGATNGPILERLLAVNLSSGPPVSPQRIEADREIWHGTPALEFYVDFEYCSDLDDDFAKLPEKGGQPLIFMIGCGHAENGEWQFKSLVAEYLTLREEARIVDEWLAHIREVGERLDPGNPQPLIFHWSHAETNAFRSARERHGWPPGWPDLGWYDFLTRVARAEPVAVRGALNFSLKSVARAMRRHGLVETEWDDSNPVDGLGAMVGAWRCDAEARRSDIPMGALPLMEDIGKYNEVDCKAIMEIVRYLRANH